MTPQEMRNAKAREITEAAQGLGWEALVEVKGYKFRAELFAEGATEQTVSGKLSKALELIDEFGGPELYPLTETYDLIPLGVKDEAAELDEFVEELTESTNEFGELLSALDEFVEHDAGEKEIEPEANDENCPSTLDLSNEGTEAMEAFIDGDDYEDPGEDAADATCADCEMRESCGMKDEEAPMNGSHEDSEFGDGRYTSPKEVWAATQTSDAPQNEHEHQHGGPKLAQEVEMSEETKGYILTAARIIADGGFVIVARPTKADQAKGFKTQLFASINRSHAKTLRDVYGYGINIAARQ